MSAARSVPEGKKYLNCRSAPPKSAKSDLQLIVLPRLRCALLLFSIFLVSIVLGTALYLTRERWMAYVPDRVQDVVYSRLPDSFMGDVESGFTSNDFDLSSNVMEGDSRGGLDQKAKRDVQRLMKIRGIGFDEARRVYMEQKFKSQV